MSGDLELTWGGGPGVLGGTVNSAEPMRLSGRFVSSG